MSSYKPEIDLEEVAKEEHSFVMKEVAKDNLASFVTRLDRHKEALGNYLVVNF